MNESIIYRGVSYPTHPAPVPGRKYRVIGLSSLRQGDEFYCDSCNEEENHKWREVDPLDWEAACYGGKVVNTCSLRDIEMECGLSSPDEQGVRHEIVESPLCPETKEPQVLSRVEVNIQIVSRDNHGHLIIAIARSFCRALIPGVDIFIPSNATHYRFVACNEADFQRVSAELARDWTRLLPTPICDDGSETIVDEQYNLRKITPRFWEELWQGVGKTENASTIR
jgi:hypothetical protein